MAMKENDVTADVDPGIYLSGGTFIVIEEAIEKARNHAMLTCRDCQARLDAVLELLRIARG